MTTIGVTGHRYLAETDKLRTKIVETLDHVVRVFPGESLTVVSALAEGADTLVAQLALERFNARLVVPLPLPREEYLNDFATNAAKNAFAVLLDNAAEIIDPPSFADRNEAYEAAGLYVLDHSDVLIAIWDGRVEQGRGGTGQIVSKARQSKKPIAWVHAGNRTAGTTTPTSLGVDQGKVTFENFESK
jgi:hypothetical protein